VASRQKYVCGAGACGEGICERVVVSANSVAGRDKPGLATNTLPTTGQVFTLVRQPGGLDEQAGANQLASRSPRALRLSMNAPPETPDLEVILRFLHRFADLMSAGSNSENLLRAATLLEANVRRANEAEEQLRQALSNCAKVEQQLAALSQDGHVKVPISILRLAASQFQALARDFANSGNVVSQAMCSASASTLARVLETNSPRQSLSRVDQSGR
jgi:hypothetical protein